MLLTFDLNLRSEAQQLLIHLLATCLTTDRSLLRRALLLREHPQNELSVLMRFKGRGDYDVLSWRQMHTLRHFPQVNVALAFSFGGCVQEEVLLQVLILSTHLWTMKTIWSERNELGKIGTLLPRRTQEY